MHAGVARVSLCYDPLVPERATQQAAKHSEAKRSRPAAEPEIQSQAPSSDTVGWLLSAADPRDPSGQADPQPGGLKVRRKNVSAGQVLALQRTMGNRAVTDILRSVAQRVAVDVSSSETLYNQTNAQGQATANSYGGSNTYEITRQGDSGVTVSVKIKYLSQQRNTTPPPNPAPPGTSPPALGQLIGSPTQIPAGDPRIAWATQMSTQAVAAWNGRLTFVGEEWNALSDNTTKRLPVTFQSTPVFNVGDDANATVIVHPPATVAGSTGQPIDAGNYYMNQGNYPQAASTIYAHEYGHLLGINDEYSQSNEQMNALLHQASPGGAASARAALDKETVERMALAGMTQPLLAQLGSAMPTVATAMQAQGDLVKQKMAAAAREAVVNPGVRTALETQLRAQADPSLSPNVPSVVAFQTTRNFSNITRAAEGVEQAFSLAALRSQIGDAYARALQAPLNANFAVAGLGDVSINVQGSVYGSLGSGPTAANATALATSTVGPTPAAPGGGGAPGGAGPGLPALPPPDSLIGQISALPATWSAAGSALESGVTGAAFATKMQSVLAAAAAAAAAPPPPGVLPTPPIGRNKELYQSAYAMVNSAATEAARQVAVDLIAGAVDPVLQSSVASLRTAITGEVAKIMSMTPAQLAAAPNPDPNMRAVVSAMKTTLDANKAATAGGGANPGAGAAAQDVTYSYQGLMGSSNTTALRADQFQPMVDQFNSRLTTTFEKKFKAETR